MMDNSTLALLAAADLKIANPDEPMVWFSRQAVADLVAIDFNARELLRLRYDARVTLDRPLTTSTRRSSAW